MDVSYPGKGSSREEGGTGEKGHNEFKEEAHKDMELLGSPDAGLFSVTPAVHVTMSQAIFSAIFSISCLYCLFTFSFLLNL